MLALRSCTREGPKGCHGGAVRFSTSRYSLVWPGFVGCRTVTKRHHNRAIPHIFVTSFFSKWSGQEAAARTTVDNVGVAHHIQARSGCARTADPRDHASVFVPIPVRFPSRFARVMRIYGFNGSMFINLITQFAQNCCQCGIARSTIFFSLMSETRLHSTASAIALNTLRTDPSWNKSLYQAAARDEPRGRATAIERSCGAIEL